MTWRTCRPGRLAWVGALVCAAAACGPASEPVAAIDPAAVAAGRELYLNNGCANCHGEDGSGRGAIAANFDPPPRDYRDPAAYRFGADAAAVAATIARGMPNPGAAMPSFGHLSEESRAQLAAYIVSLQHPDSALIDLRDGWIAESIPGSDSVGAWFTLVSEGAEDAVVGVEIGGGRARLHRSVQMEGMMQMDSLERLVIPAGGQLILEPGGDHVMIDRLANPLQAGESVWMTLFLESGTAVRVELPVRRREGAG